MQPVRLVLHKFKRTYDLRRLAIGSTFIKPRGKLCHRPLTSTWGIRPYSTLQWTEIQPYNAIRVRLKDEENWDNKEFAMALKSYTINFVDLHSFYYLAHLKEWKAEGRSGVWLHIPIKHCALIKDAVDAGLSIHHSQREEIALCAWLDDSRPNKIPHFADHQVGVCGEMGEGGRDGERERERVSERELII